MKIKKAVGYIHNPDSPKRIVNLYSDVVKETKRFNETSDCAIVCVAVATGVPYEVVHRKMKALGRRARAGTRWTITLQCFTELGFKLNRIVAPSKTIRTLPDKLDHTKTYVARVNGHVLCIKNGIVEDWSKGSRKRIAELFELIPPQ